jgi:hypothetical protein
MFEKLKSAIIPHLIGLVLIILGWYISILNVGLTRFQPDVLFTKWTFFGLCLILAGAYLPEIWLGIRGIFKKNS